MNNLLITCHVEPLKRDNSLDYLDNFFIKTSELKIKPVYLLIFGNSIEDRILRKFANSNYGLHIHDGRTEEGIKAYKKIFHKYPRDISFGHWQYSQNDIDLVKKYKIKNEYSFSAYRNNIKYFTKKPFTKDGTMFFPVSCNPKHPLNPFTTWYDFFISVILILINKFIKLDDLHLSFHSYDLCSNVCFMFRWQIIKFLISKR